MAYRLEGDLLEVCNCDVLCPCWIGEDPDRGHCDSALAYRINSGAVGGARRRWGHHGLGGEDPGQRLRRAAGGGSSTSTRRASEAQAEVLVEAMTGRLGGPLADLAALVGDDLPPQRAEIVFDLHEGQGRFAIAGVSEAVMAPYRGGDGNVTTLNNSAFSTIPGSPAYVAKAERFRLRHVALGLDLELQGKNAIQGSFRFEA